MDLALATLILLLAAFIFVMLGQGGGMVYVPVLLWLGFDLKEVAIPLGLLLNGLTTALALIPYGRQGLIHFRGLWPMGLAAVIGAPLGAALVPYIPQQTLVQIFAAMVMIAAIKTLWTNLRQKNRVEREEHSPWHVPISVLLGGLIGVLAGMLGIGGGFLFMPLLLWLGYPTKRAAAGAALVVTFASFSGFLGHVAQGHFPILITSLGIVAVLIGSQAGARFMIHKANPRHVKILYGIVLLGIFAKLATKAFA